MKGGGGGSDGNMTKSWCTNCRRISTLMLATPLHPSSSSSPSRRGVNSLLKVAMILATVVLLLSVYQSCAPTESSLPVWLSLSFVSRPSFILSSAELSQQPQERPASRLVETVGSIPLERNLSTTLPSAGASFSSDKGTGPSEDQPGDEKSVERDSFEEQNGSVINLQRASDLSDSDSSAAEKDSAQDPLQSSVHGSSTSDVNSLSVEKDVLVDPVEDSRGVSNSRDSSDVEKDEFKASEAAVVFAETTSMEGANSNSSDSYSSALEQDEPKESEIMLPSETTSTERVNSNSSDSHPSPSSFEEKDEPKESKAVFLSETTSMESVISNPIDSFTPSSSSVEKDGVKEGGTTVIAEATSTESAKNDGLNEGKISEDGGLEKEQLGGAVSSNWSQETAPEKEAAIRTQETIPQTDAAIQSENGAPHQDAVTDLASAPAAQSTEPELSQRALGQPPADTQLASPSQFAENPKDERRVRLEEQLHAAKQAIEEATLADADPSLYPVIYRNVSAFSKSYKLMEEMFKIYVYADGKPPLVHTGPLLGIYASEGRFIDRISRGSPFIVEDPELAHMFYLPYSVTQMTLTIYVEGSHSMQPLNTFIKDYVEQVAATYPFWNRTRGADHFFVSCHDWGPATARDHEELRKNAMKVVCNADLNEEYVLGKDASLPEIYLHNYKRAKVGGPGAVRRSILAFFAGQMHGHVRPMLIEHWKDKDPDMKIYEVLPKSIERKMNYVEHMKNSKYCICAAGFEVNSPRIVESIYYDCVPVIIADNFVLPFSDVLNWSTFSVTLPESEIPNLKSILSSISDRQYRAMQKRLSKVRQHFLWNDEPVKYDVFHMIMHSVWMSRLNRLNL